LGTLAALAILIVVMGAMELVAHLFAPKEILDPRLGFVAFWLSVALVALAIYAFWPLMRQRNNWLERLLSALWIGAWTAWKAGLFGDTQHTQRDHEQIWATTVGSAAGIILHEAMGGSSV
jgi:hypothetical protein